MQVPDSFSKDLIKGFSDFLKVQKTGKYKLEFLKVTLAI